MAPWIRTAQSRRTKPILASKCTISLIMCFTKFAAVAARTLSQFLRLTERAHRNGDISAEIMLRNIVSTGFGGRGRPIYRPFG